MLEPEVKEKNVHTLYPWFFFFPINFFGFPLGL